MPKQHPLHHQGYQATEKLPYASMPLAAATSCYSFANVSNRIQTWHSYCTIACCRPTNSMQGGFVG